MANFRPKLTLAKDINNSGDGGIYAELILNRAFQGSEAFPTSLEGWSPVGGAELKLKNLTTPLSKALPTSVHVAAGTQGSVVGISNSGFSGLVRSSDVEMSESPVVKVGSGISSDVAMPKSTAFTK